MNEPRKLLRSPDDRVIGGVAGGLGRYFRIDPIIFRIGFAALAFVGGLGVFAYLAALVFVPADDGTGRPKPSRARKVALVALVVLVALAVLCTVAVASAWATAEGLGFLAAGAVVLLGVVMVVASFGAGAAWLAAPALAIAIPAGAVAATDFELRGGYGERYWHPATVAEIPAGGYEHAVGEAVVDLRGLDWRRGQTVDLEVDQGIGELRVITPEDVCVQLDAHVDGGAIWFRGDEDGGVDYRREETPGASSAPRLRLDADLTFGEIVVADNDVAGRPHRWHDLDDPERLGALRRAEEACETR